MANGTGQQVDDWVSAYPAQTGAPPPPAPSPQPAPPPAPPPQTPQAGPDDWQGAEDWQGPGTDTDPRFSTASLGPYFQPDFETTVYGKAPPPEPDDFVHNWMINPFKQTAASLAEAHANAAHLGSNVAGFLDDASNWVHQKTGLPYSHSMQYVKNMFDEMHKEAQGVASDFAGGRQDIGSRIVRGVGNVAFNAPAYVLATQALGPVGGMALMGGLQNLDQGAGATLQGAAEGAGLGAAMWVMGPMGRLVRLNGNALLNYGYSKLKGADDDTALMNAGIGGLVGMLPEKQPYPEWWTRARPGVTVNLTPQAAASEEYMAGQGIQTPAGMRLGSDWMQKFGGTLQGLPGGGRYGRGIQEAQQKLIGPVQEAELGGIHPEKVTPEEAATGVQEQLEKNLEDTKNQIAQQVHPTATTPEEAGTAIQTRLSSDLANERTAIAQQVHPTPTTPEAAGQGVIDRGKQSIQALSKEANQNYNAVRQVENHPRNLELVPVRDKNGDLVYNEDGSQKREKMALPIDMQDIQDTLAPVAARYEYTLTPTQRRDSPGLTAMQQIINGPRYKPLSAAELDLSMLKGAARTEKGLAELRDQSQGLAALSVSQLQNQIDNTMAGAHVPGWDPASGTPHPGLANLQAGRAATAEKYRIADVLSGFGRQNPDELEPVGVFNRMTWGRDSGINHLREVAQIAPNEMPAVGRAFVESGGDVNQLGPQTKQILFRDPNVIRAIEQHQVRRQMFEPLTRMEPVQLVNRLTQAGGVRNNLLRAVAAQAPEQIPPLARAFIDSDANWNRLDPESKGILFHDTPTIQALDRYHANKQLFGPLIKMEPVLLSQRLAALGGTRNKLLEAVAKQTPEQMPRIARAWIQGLLERATREGTPQKVQSTIDEWLDMDPKSKALLLGNDAQQIRNLNNFFMSYKRLALNVNPSGSGFIQALNHWKGLVTGGVGAAIGMHTGHGVGMGMLTAAGFEALSNAAMSRLLFNERFIRMINKGMREQEAGNPQGARLAAASALQAASEHQEPPEEPPEGPPEDEPPEEPPTGPPAGGPPTPTGGGGEAQSAAAKLPEVGDTIEVFAPRLNEEGGEWVRGAVKEIWQSPSGEKLPVIEGPDGSEEVGTPGYWRLPEEQPAEGNSAYQKLQQIGDEAFQRVQERGSGPGGTRLNAISPRDIMDMSIWGASRIGQGLIDPVQLRREIAAKYGDIFGAIPRKVLGEVSDRAKARALKAVKIWTPGMKLDDIHPLTPETIPKAGAQLSKEDVISYLDKQVKEHVGPVDFDAPPKVKMQRLMKYARKEMADQLSQPDPKLDFYTTDTPQADADMIQMFPELGTDSEKMTLMKAASAVLAQGSNPEAEAMNGGRAYAYYRQHGRLPEMQPDDGIPGQNPGKQWSTTSGSDPIIKLQRFIDAFKSPADPTGLLELEKFLKGRFTVATLKQLNSSVAGAANDIKSGSLILGPKIGSYYLDIAGIPQEGATVDMWDALGQYRRLGSMYAANGKPLVAPRGPDRPLFMDVHRRLENELGLKRTQSQSGLWHYEKDLYRRLGVPTPVKGRSDGTKRLLDAWGFQRQNIKP